MSALHADQAAQDMNRDVQDKGLEVSPVSGNGHEAVFRFRDAGREWYLVTVKSLGRGL